MNVGVTIYVKELVNAIFILKTRLFFKMLTKSKKKLSENYILLI